MVSDAASFAEAKEIPRAVSHGDHSIIVFDQLDQVVPLTVQFIDQALLAGGLVMAMVPQELEDAILETMHPDDARGIAWEPPTDTYGPAFDPETVVARFEDIAQTESRPVFVVGCPGIPIQDFSSKDAWVQYERLAHELAVEYGLTVLCLYDARLHHPELVEVGLKTHSLAGDGDGLLRNEDFDYEPPA